MTSRLVLGVGTLGSTLVEALADREGLLHVLTGDPSRVETLRTESVAAERADPTDPEDVAAIAPVDVVLVASDDADANRAAAEAAREAHPDALLVVYVGEDATAPQRSRLAALADRLIDPGGAMLAHIEAIVTTRSDERARGLREALVAVDRLGVFTHDNPDPDAIASAVALVRIAESLGVEAEACYYGAISHQENRALVNLLDLDLRNLDPDEELGYDAVALVDHTRPGVNDQLPSDVRVAAVIDHHPGAEPVEATFVDRRTTVGATSTLLTDYVRRFDVDVDGAVATALLYGIRVDTKDFLREITPDDFEAAAYLVERADESVLERVESPSVSADTLETLARAVRNRRLQGSALVSCVGTINDRDALAQAADQLLAMEGVRTALVTGFAEGTIYVSARTRQADFDLGTALRVAFDDIGSAGGHTDMAGAQIPLGLFAEMESEAERSLAQIIADVVSERFFGAVRNASRSGSPAPPSS